MTDSKQKILVVDDERLNIDVLVDILRADYNVVVAKNGQEALRRAASAQPPELILLDIMMPDMNGYEVCKKLKKDTQTSEIPVIFITALNDSGDEEKGFNAGAVDYISKPFSASTVRARVKSHITLYKQKRCLVELNVLKNRFLGIASHDLRNPSSLIKNFCEIMLNDTDLGVLSQDHRDIVQNIHTASSELLTLLNDLLDVSAIESGKLPLVIKQGSLKSLLTKRVKNSRINAEKKGITVHEHFEDVPDALFDPDRINQVVDNLISNAMKFSPKGSNIYVYLSQAGEDAVVRVKDEGPGIPEEAQSNLFKEFNRLGTKTTGGEKSTGFGLFIVKNIVDAHGGSISVTSTLGSGAEFKFTIPLA
ncbi:hybrid sensor histidine kinase/response regulator [Candidatus Magnetomonas plexicatena]|uniref:hybrid sensor histidine kinase/response regulator n=1 Tax=Candidatus Magnetomonas plexicatena TaxID=2552947 RepID=UPI001C758C8E|nr:hybrid sensor histidine kinase/response regulator [Nitrospirales bacterium LBB_01]